MSEFEDTIIKDSSANTATTTGAGRVVNPSMNNANDPPIPKSKPSKAKSKAANKSLIDLIMKEGEDASTLADKYSLDPELTQKVLVPLLNFLDKYEIGNEVASSPTAQGLGDLASIIGDVAPVIRNAASYFEGRANNLSAEDEAFLAKIREAQQGSAGGLFLEEGVGESDFNSELSFGVAVDGDGATNHPGVAGVATEINSSYDGPIPINTNPFADGVDWAAVLGADPSYATPGQSVGYTYTEMMPDSDLMIKGLEDLAREAGLDPSKVASSDTQNKINNKPSTDAFSAGVTPDTTENLSEIQQAMKKEQARQASQSKVIFGDDGLKTPANITTYDPLNVPGFESPPVLKTKLESAEEIAARAGIDLNAVETVETFETFETALGESESEIVWLTDEEAAEQGYEEIDIEDETDDLGLSPFTFDESTVEVLQEVKKQLDFGEASDDDQE